jgi:hypothetical protein
MIDKHERSVGELFADLGSELSTLFRQEVALAKTEMSEKANKAARQATSLVMGGAIAYAALLAFIASIIIFLGRYIPLWASALLVAVVFGTAGAVMVSGALRKLKQMDPAPRQTIETLKEDAAWAKQQVK